MNRKKVTAVSLYLKDLKQNGGGKYYDMKSASMKFRSLSIQEKDYYDVSAKRINEQNAPAAVFTTQRDTLGNNLKEVTDIDNRKKEWQRQTLKTILQIGASKDILKKEFVAVKISGVDFCKSEDQKRVYVSSEICFIKFSFMKGIIDKLILFPELITVAAGYRQHLYEDMEENVGWKPEMFRSHHSIQDSILLIRKFFNGDYEPIYVPTKDHQEEVGLALETLYDEAGMQCPWLESYADWGKKCSIYQLEYLITSVLQRNINCSVIEDFQVSVVLDFWRKMNIDIAPEICERHEQHGLSNQCATNILQKYIYGSFLLMNSDEMPNIQTLVSSDFYRELDFIIPVENTDQQSNSNNTNKNTDNWTNYIFNKSSIEDVITGFSGITINEMNSASVYKKQIEWGRGRGKPKQQDGNNFIPGSMGFRKLKLPKVVC